MMKLPTQANAALASLRQTLNTTSGEATDRAAKLASHLSDEQLEQLMRSPLRRPVTAAVFFAMPRYLNRSRARGVNLAIRWRVTAPEDRDDVDIYDLVISERRCRVHRGERGPAPLITITVDSVEFIRIATGRSNPMQAYFDGKLKLRGDIMQAARLTALFKIPGSTPPAAG
jgi:alkyl sulfatase BDS1-like metallo-beta-lactamase superfamily hydrolase